MFYAHARGFFSLILACIYILIVYSAHIIEAFFINDSVVPMGTFLIRSPERLRDLIDRHFTNTPWPLEKNLKIRNMQDI